MERNANEIVELAFALTLGAIAVAIALSYGLGGRAAAGEHFKDIIQKFRKEASELPAPSEVGSKIQGTLGTTNLRNPNDPTLGNINPIT